jgi:DNA-binding CsgD family transcriptional regulator
MTNVDRPDMEPTPLQLARFRAYAEAGSLKVAAHRLRISYSTLKNDLSSLYARLGVSGAIEALFALGWLLPPDPGSCGWVGRCSRPDAHRGQHGGFRGVPRRAAA